MILFSLLKTNALCFIIVNKEIYNIKKLALPKNIIKLKLAIYMMLLIMKAIKLLIIFLKKTIV